MRPIPTLKLYLKSLTSLLYVYETRAAFYLLPGQEYPGISSGFSSQQSPLMSHSTALSINNILLLDRILYDV